MERAVIELPKEPQFSFIQILQQPDSAETSSTAYGSINLWFYDWMGRALDRPNTRPAFKMKRKKATNTNGAFEPFRFRFYILFLSFWSLRSFEWNLVSIYYCWYRCKSFNARHTYLYQVTKNRCHRCLLSLVLSFSCGANIVCAHKNICFPFCSSDVFSICWAIVLQEARRLPRWRALNKQVCEWGTCARTTALWKPSRQMALRAIAPERCNDAVLVWFASCWSNQCKYWFKIKAAAAAAAIWPHIVHRSMQIFLCPMHTQMAEHRRESPEIYNVKFHFFCQRKMHWIRKEKVMIVCKSYGLWKPNCLARKKRQQQQRGAVQPTSRLGAFQALQKKKKNGRNPLRSISAACNQMGNWIEVSKMSIEWCRFTHFSLSFHFFIFSVWPHRNIDAQQ